MSTTTRDPVRLPLAAPVKLRGCAVDLVRCTRCGLPETYETIEFDAEGGVITGQVMNLETDMVGAIREAISATIHD